jgi:hypothetical protein
LDKKSSKIKSELQIEPSPSSVGSFSDPELEDSNERKYSPFLHLNPECIEFTSLVPEFPKSHENGYGTVIDLPDSVLISEAQVMNLIKAMQYSRSNQGGGGIRVKDNIEFFSKQGESHEDNQVSMGYHARQCAGVKVCEYFPVTSHTEVDPTSIFQLLFILILI